MPAAKRSRNMPKKTAEEKAEEKVEKDIFRKLRKLCEYCKSTGDWEPARDIHALLKKAERILDETRHAMGLPKMPRMKISRTKAPRH
jgi:hypothetical protein